MNAQMQSVLVVGGGWSVNLERLKQCAGRYDGLIAADAGAAPLRQADMPPLFLVGDLDSITPEDRAWVPADRVRASTDPSHTDLEKAILLALELGAKKVGMICVSGDRIDHTVNGLSLMLRYRTRAEFTWHDDRGDATLALPPGTTIAGKPGDKVSLVPAPGAAAVRTSGLKYMLDGVDLTFGSRDGVSNELQVAAARVQFKTGSLLVYRHLETPAAS